MAKSPMETMVGREVRGRVDNVVYRKLLGEMILARRPRKFEKPPTDVQLGVRERFRLASAYAKGVIRDPARKQPYLDYVAEHNLTTARLFSIIARDFLRAPTVPDIHTDGYHRQPGGEIRLTVIDDTKVTGVTVSISRQSDGHVLESGTATYRSPYWYYVATTVAPAAPEMLVIKVTATDLAGNVSTETMGLST